MNVRVAHVSGGDEPEAMIGIRIPEGIDYRASFYA
jgi:hypothetical protein